MGDTVINLDAVFDDARPPDQNPDEACQSTLRPGDTNQTAPQRLTEAENKPPKSEPVELSYDERIATGLVNPGWTAEDWRDRLIQLADRCEAIRADLAIDYRRWAANIRVTPK